MLEFSDAFFDNDNTELRQWLGSRKAPQGKMMHAKISLATLSIQNGLTSSLYRKLAAPIAWCVNRAGG